MDRPKLYVYVIRTVANPPRYYTGLAADVSERLKNHNSGSSPHTARHRPWRLHVVIGFTDEARAAAFERFLKSGSGRSFSRTHFESGQTP